MTRDDAQAKARKLCIRATIASNHDVNLCPQCRNVAAALMTAYADGIERGWQPESQIAFLEPERIRAEAAKLASGE